MTVNEVLCSLITQELLNRFSSFWCLWLHMVTLSVNSLYGATPGPRDACPNQFSFIAKKSAIWQNEHVTLFEGNGWTDINEVSGETYDCPAALLCYYFGNYAETTWGPLPASFIILKNGAAISWKKRELSARERHVPHITLSETRCLIWVFVQSTAKSW